MTSAAQPGGTFFERKSMRTFPKHILSIADQVQSFLDAGMMIESTADAETVLARVGYYRLRGYCFQWYDNRKKKYREGTSFSNLSRLYLFDHQLSQLLFAYSSQIEIALRARFTDAMLVYNDALILMDPSVCDDKTNYWKNLSVLSNEIARSNDVFIDHHFHHHEGQIPLWAAIEVTTFGNLSKLIKNMSTDPNGAYPLLAKYYMYKTQNGNNARPSKKMLTSWIQAVSIVRNICAHNGRLYNRTISTIPELLHSDRIMPQPHHNGLYQILLAMKYLRPDDDSWTVFVSNLEKLIDQYSDVVLTTCLNFPSDWRTHLAL